MSEAEMTKPNGTSLEAVDKNAQAKSEVDEILAQLQAKKAAAAPAPEKEEASDEKQAKSEEVKDTVKDEARGTNEEDTYRSERRQREHSRERGDRQEGRGFHRGGRGGGRGGFQKRNNNKFDPSTQEESDDPFAIRKQVEFYFSDSNLPLDKFLLSKVGGAENNPVELDILCSFKRMRQFQPRSAVVAALKDSAVIELVDDDTKVKRKVPLSEELADSNNDTVVKVFEDRAMPRSIYAKGFGEELPSTQFDIEAFFAPYGPTNAIRLRRKDHDKSFKGSVFVEFDSEDTMKKFLELDPRPEYKGKKLQIMTKKEYCDGKAADIAVGKIRASSPRGGFSNNRKRDRDDRDWRDRRDDDRRRDHKRGGGRGFGSKGGRDNRDRGDRNREREARLAAPPTIWYPGIDDDTKNSRENRNESTAIDKDTETADAVARARAVVAAEQVKEQHEAEANKVTDVATTNGSEKDGDDVAAGQKRARGEDTSEAIEGEREAKKADVKES